MTCIVGIAHEGVVYMGGDRAASDGDSIIPLMNPKIELRNGWVYGYAGTIGIGQLMSFISLPSECDDPYTYIRLSIVEDMKNAIDAFSHAPENPDTSWLIGRNGRLFEISAGDWGVIEIKESSIGTGSTYALGSLYTTDKVYSESPDYMRIRLRLAVEAAITYSPDCLGPVDILSV